MMRKILCYVLLVVLVCPVCESLAEECVYTNLPEKRGALVSGEIYGSGEIRGKRHPLHL